MLVFILTFLLMRLLAVPEGTWPPIALAVVCGAGDISTALWRGGDVIVGSLLALLFTGIYPQRAYILWRMQMANACRTWGKSTGVDLSPNRVIEPRQKALLSEVVKLRGLITPASKETHIPKPVFEAVQTLSRNLVCTLELLAHAFWAARETHFILLNAKSLRRSQLLTQRAIGLLARIMRNGESEDLHAISNELSDISVELKVLIQAASAAQSSEAPIYSYVSLSMEMAHQLKELGDLLKVCTASGRE